MDVENTSRNSPDGAGAGGTAAALPRWLTGVMITAIAAATLAALLAPWLRSQQAPSPSGPQVVAVIFGGAAAGAGVRLGSSAPNFQWVDNAGRIQELVSQRGRIVVLNFWATWCVPCRTELPVLERAAIAHPEVTFLAIDLQEEAEPVRAFFDALGLTAVEPMLDPQGAVTRRYGVVGLPSTFFLDRDGVVRQIDIGGQVNEERIASGLRKATAGGE